MKKILFSLMAIALVVGLVGAGAFAYFFDTETSTGNTFTAGTIDIDVDGENPWTGNYTVAIGSDVLLKPCEVGYIEFTINNVGNNPLKVWKHLTDVDCTGGTHPESELGEDPDDTLNDISGVIRYDLSVDGSPLIEEAANYTITAGSHQLDGATIGIASTWVELGEILPNDLMVVSQSYHMDEDTTNWAQGDVMTFTIELYAEQLGGLGKK